MEIELPRFWWVPLGRVPEIEAPALYQALSAAQRPQILDVRTRLECKRGHIEGAVHVPMRGSSDHGWKVCPSIATGR